jgi:predicted  nucleic acid-binding Zn-ribbon protein
MARTKQTARRSTRAITNVALLEENQMLHGKVNDLETEIEEMKKRCNCGSLSSSNVKRLKKLQNCIHELETLKGDLQ